MTTKARKILDEIGNNISGDAMEWILSIDKLEKENRELKGKLGISEPEPEPAFQEPEPVEAGDDEDDQE